MRIKRRKKIRKTEFERLFVEKHRKLFILRKKNRTERKKIKSPAVNSGLAPLRVLRIFGKFRAKPKFVYICEVPCTNAATAGQAGGTLGDTLELHKTHKRNTEKKYRKRKEFC